MSISTWISFPLPCMKLIQIYSCKKFPVILIQVRHLVSLSWAVCLYCAIKKSPGWTHQESTKKKQKNSFPRLMPELSSLQMKCNGGKEGKNSSKLRRNFFTFSFFCLTFYSSCTPFFSYARPTEGKALKNFSLPGVQHRLSTERSTRVVVF